MVTPREIRAARALLGWTRQKLADRAVVSLNSVVRFEQAVVDPRTSTVEALRRALERAGVTFLSQGQNGVEGVMVRSKKTRF